ncbi:MAG: insulinase family protein [Gemmatales bacterium]|nr:insulinase family protein [Gemmatales bacterium]MDW8386464.1 pitrilysin family protein [Gemmatales bacterium]
MRTGLILSLLLTSAGLSLVQAAEPPPPRKITTVEGITEYRLHNGMQVLLFPDPSKPTVTVNLTIFVGSRHEGYGETGMAHLLEHMVFKGTPTHPNIPKALQDRGARFNGTTSYDRTNYFETLPASDENLEFAIRLEADRMVNSYIKREDLLSEMTVVRNEFEMGENSPLNILSQRIMATAYEWHNYGKTVIGNRSDIERVPIENLQAFYRKYYQPDNAMVVVAGKFDEAKALALVNKYFGAIPRPERKLQQTYTEEPAQDGERLVILRRVGDIGAVGVVYHIPAGPHPDYPALEVLEQLMTTAPSGRLYKALVETRKAASVSGDAAALHDPGVIEFLATVNRDGNLEEVRDIMLKVLEGAAADGFTEEEVRRAKQQILKNRELAQADSSRLAIGLSEWAAQGDWRLYFLHRDRLEKVTPEDVRRVADAYLRRNNRTLGMFIPTQEPERVAIPATPKVHDLVADYRGREAVASGETLDPNPAELEKRIRRVQLNDGVQIALLPYRTRNQAAYALVMLRFGNAENLKGLTAAGGILNDLMLRGTRKLTHQQLQDELDRLQARMGTGFGGFGGRRLMGMSTGQVGSISFAIQAKRDTLPEVLELLRQVLREPALPPEQFEILKRNRLADLEATRTEPTALAARAVQRQLSPYPKGDVRYVPTIDEEIAELQALTYDQVRKLYDEYVGAQAVEVVLLGDFDPDKCLSIVSETLSGWKAKQPYQRIERTVADKSAASKQSLTTPDKANAVYFAALPLAMRDDDPEYPAMVMANYILGGGSLSSRLGDRVRQKEGLSYTVASIFSADPYDARGSLAIFAICNPENIGKVEKAIAEELEKLVRDGITAAELDAAKKGYLQQQNITRATEMMLASQLAGTLYAKRTFRYHDDLERKIAELTVDQVNSAIRNHVDPQKFIIVTAGDFRK